MRRDTREIRKAYRDKSAEGERPQTIPRLSRLESSLKFRALWGDRMGSYVSADRDRGTLHFPLQIPLGRRSFPRLCPASGHTVAVGFCPVLTTGHHCPHVPVVGSAMFSSLNEWNFFSGWFVRVSIGITLR